MVKFPFKIIINFHRIGNHLIIDNWHFEYRLKKNSHHLELFLIVEKGSIQHNKDDNNKSLKNLNIKIDLLSDGHLLEKNKEYAEAINKLRNLLIKVYKIQMHFHFFFRKKQNIKMANRQKILKVF